MGIFSGRHFPRDIILRAVRWYCRYGVSYRDLEEMMTERGVPVDHTTIYRWVAISELKAEGICPQTVEHRQVKYLNNVLEGDHGRLKRILGPKGAFKNRTSAYRTLKGMEAMHSLRKGQVTMFAYGHPNPDTVIVSRIFETA